MRILRSLPLPLAIALATAVAPASAQLATFDDLSDCAPSNTIGMLIPNGYAGFNWSNFYVAHGPNTAASMSPDGQGYANGVITPSCIALNGFGGPASITAATPFTFNGGYFTAAFTDNLSVLIRGFSGATQLFSQMLMLNSTTPQLLDVNWTGLDRVLFESGDGRAGSQFVFDNFRFNNASDPTLPTVTPEPASMILLGTGLAALAARRGRRNGAQKGDI